MTDAADANNDESGKEQSDDTGLESMSLNSSDSDNNDSGNDPAGHRDADFSDLAGSVELERLEKLLAEKEQEAKDFKDKYLRALADLENFKKRSIKERSELVKYQGEKIVCDFLPVMDNLELALEHSEGDAESLRTGVELIAKIFKEALARWQIEAVDALGQPFDPNVQNAISKIPSEDAEPGTVIQVLKKAYKYKGKLIREGEVVVADQSQAPTEEED